MDTNVLYYGDNLEVLRKHIPSESVDLIYLDPPFNSNRSYNVLFKESSGAGSEAQIEAFEDAWHWGPAAQAAYEEVVTGPHQSVARMLRTMVEGLERNDVTAYLAMMAVRLVELRRVLKPAGSIYLHCDPTAGPYLRVLMDAVFGARNFVNEIAWKRTSAHNDPKRYGSIHDTLLFFQKSSTRRWNSQFTRDDVTYFKAHDFMVDTDGRRYRLRDVTAPDHGTPAAGLRYTWNGIDPPEGRTWTMVKDKMDELHAAGLIVLNKQGFPLMKRFVDELPGVVLQDMWTDITLNAAAKERLGYPTQKPLALLERIISASSNDGDVVLDPFCGCGTAVHAAQKLNRRWIGIDITHLAIGLIRRRMEDAFPGIEIRVIGEPVDVGGARELAAKDKYQFQWWVLDRIGAQPVAGKKKGADRGIDGVLPFFDSPQTDFKRALVSVKGGEHVSVTAVRDLMAVLQRENEPIGVVVALAKPTREMVSEAAAAGTYRNDYWQKEYPRVQLLTVEEVLADRRPQTPPQKSPFAKAPLEREAAKTERLL